MERSNSQIKGDSHRIRNREDHCIRLKIRGVSSTPIVRLQAQKLVAQHSSRSCGVTLEDAATMVDTSIETCGYLDPSLA